MPRWTKRGGVSFSGWFIYLFPIAAAVATRDANKITDAREPHVNQVCGRIQKKHKNKNINKKKELKKNTYDEPTVDFFENLLLVQGHGLAFPLFDPFLFQLLTGVHLPRRPHLARADLEYGRNGEGSGWTVPCASGKLLVQEIALSWSSSKSFDVRRSSLNKVGTEARRHRTPLTAKRGVEVNVST